MTVSIISYLFKLFFMGNYSYQKGWEAGKNGDKPDPPKDNSLSDYIFQTQLSDKQLKEEREDYKRGYESGSRQNDSSESSSSDGGSGK